MQPNTANPLSGYFFNNNGRLIHKWHHYFDIYHRHLETYRDRPITFLEFGVFHGGSLQMWKQYFGPRARILGVDINPACKSLVEEQIEIRIGDQEDRQFLRSLVAEFGPFDVVLDDGGHTMPQQINTFEELYPAVTDNGMYVVEDLLTSYRPTFQGGYLRPNTFIEYAKRLIDQLHAWHSHEPDRFQVTPFTRSAYGMHWYDSILVIEKKARLPPTHSKTGRPSF